ncbi:hypothetical protein CTEN210_15220 [Chaetoceros tenuissimus]|uniref:Uncharacterized protein n=1 Tax=Chaetoceros tenuissimus TaxID=426638 RepID=A0AAD3HD21_9STRA|nr:hypothetical protein CTEN210_15220 [Chaetoceros tenuissimus]
MKSNTAKAASSQTKRRKRQVTSQNEGKGADLPEIAQVPPITVPYLIEAIKLNKKMISAKHKQLASRDGNTRNENVDVPHDSNDVHDAIFARIQQQSRNSELDELQENAATSINTLLQQCQQQTKITKRSVYDDEYDDTELPTGCGVGCFDFCLGLIIDESTKIILRNAAFRVCRGLVEERNDCRLVFANKIKIIADAIGDADKHLRKFPKIGSPPHVVLFQREALIFINDLTQRFPSIRPTLMIAARYLEEQKHISLGNESAESSFKRKSNSGLAELRRIRDLALLNTDKEVEKVRKLLMKVDACFEVLVPRFGHESEQTKTKLLLEATLHSTNDDIDVNQELVLDYDEVSDDDEEDVDWEDGDKSEEIEKEREGGVKEETCQNQLNEDDHEEHKVRVERTLAVMKQTRALQNDGTIGISMDREQNGIHHKQDEELQEYRELLAITAAKQIGVKDVEPQVSETTMPFNPVSNSMNETSVNSENISHLAWSESHTSSRNQSLQLSRSRQPKKRRRFDVRLSRKST